MLGRLWIYVKEMFPLTYFFTGPFMSLVFWKAMATLQGFKLVWKSEYVYAGLTISLCTLLLRVMDEIKDYTDDKVNFPQRALPRGAVQVGDLKIFMSLLVLAIIGLNLFHPLALLSTALILIQSGLMFKWFFIKTRIQRNLPLALLTHHPIVLSYFLYLSLVYFLFYPVEFKVLLIIPGLAAVFTHWEISRKMRSPAGEDTYTTYSKIWGRNACLILTSGLRALTCLSLIYLLNPSLFISAIWIILWAVLEIRFYHQMYSPQAVKNLKTEAEIWSSASLMLTLAAAW